VRSTRARQSALLVALAICAAAAVLIFAERTLPRAVAGTVLALLPWAAAARLEIVRQIDLPGGRFAAAGGLALASLVLLGLVLTVTNIGLTEDSAAIGTALIALALTLAGHTAGDAWSPPPRVSPVGSVLLAAAAAIVVVAFALARGGALESARQGSGYAAFVVGQGKGARLGLRNATELPARFIVRVTGEGRDTRTTLDLAPDRLRLIPMPTTTSGDLDIRIVVRVDGRRKGPAMTLSTSQLS
jgi:hypothetical protein